MDQDFLPPSRLVLVDDDLAAAWDRLAVATGAPPFLRPGWVRAWMGAFEPRRPLHALTVHDAGELIALLPVVRRRNSLRVPTNAETPAMGPVLRAPHLARGLLDPWAGRHRLDLGFAVADGPAELLADGARERGLLTSSHPVRRSPYTRVDGTWEDYQRTVLTTSRRRDLRRNERRLAAEGGVTLTTHDGALDLDELLQRGLEIEAAGWKGQEGTAVLSRPATTAFYRSVARWAAAAGVLRLYFLHVHDRPIAFSLNLEQDRTSYGLKTAYSPSHKAFGPGVLLLHRLVADGFARPDVDVLEHLGEDDPFKREFSTGVREQVSVQVLAGGLRGRAQQQAGRVSPVLVEQVRRHTTPESRRAIQRLLANVRR